MMEERKTEEIETDKWKILFKQPNDQPFDEGYIELIFRLKSDQTGVRTISPEDLEQLKKDMEDLGKWRKFRELKKDLEN
ncbi:MAG: hypothetical protein KKF50_01315 [Nanoarchaeota archaeon]|nr:hypothetical protein [Nanoarchaeota archaeon]